MKAVECSPEDVKNLSMPVIRRPSDPHHVIFKIEVSHGRTT